MSPYVTGIVDVIDVDVWRRLIDDMIVSSTVDENYEIVIFAQYLKAEESQEVVSKTFDTDVVPSHLITASANQASTWWGTTRSNVETRGAITTGLAATPSR